MGAEERGKEEKIVCMTDERYFVAKRHELVVDSRCEG